MKGSNRKMENQKLEYVNKAIQVSDITIKNVPVIKDNRDFEDTQLIH